MAARELGAANFYGDRLPRPFLLPQIEKAATTSLTVESFTNPNSRQDRPPVPQSALLVWAEQATWRHGGSMTKGTARKPMSSSYDLKPKRPLSAFFLFGKEERLKVATEKPALAKNVADMSREVGLRWKALPEDQKSKWKELADSQKTAYLLATEQWRRKHIGSTSVLPKSSKKRRRSSKSPGSAKTKVQKKKKGKKTIIRRLIDRMSKKRELSRLSRMSAQAEATPVAKGATGKAKRGGSPRTPSVKPVRAHASVVTPKATPPGGSRRTSPRSTPSRSRFTTPPATVEVVPSSQVKTPSAPIKKRRAVATPPKRKSPRRGTLTL